MLLCALILSVICPACNGQLRGVVTEDTLLKLKARFLENPLQKWIFRGTYAAIEDLEITFPQINRSIHYHHPQSSRTKNFFTKALNGEPVRISILGGSISAGATLYKDGNEDKIYFYPLLHWWNEVVKPITGSEMTISNYALGAIGSDFYAYCLENYVRENSTDLVIWELSANDYHRFDNRDVPATLPLELLLRNVLRLPYHPAVVLAHFFRGKDYLKEGDCNNLELDGANYLARYYRVPSVSWKKLVCRSLIQNDKVLFKKLFAADSSHPSVLGHAQMGYLLIQLFRRLFLHIVDHLLTPGLDGSNAISPWTLLLEDVEPAPKAVYTKSSLVTEQPICFTFNLPSDGTMPFNRKQMLRVVRNDGYIISIAHGFLVRKDKTRGLRTREPNQELHLEIFVPPQTSPGMSDWMILIGSYSNFGGAMFFLDTRFSRVIETEKYAYGSIVAAVATHVKPGRHSLVIKSLRKGFFLSSVMLG